MSLPNPDVNSSSQPDKSSVTKLPIPVVNLIDATPVSSSASVTVNNNITNTSTNDKKMNIVNPSSNDLLDKSSTTSDNINASTSTSNSINDNKSTPSSFNLVPSASSNSTPSNDNTPTSGYKPFPWYRIFAYDFILWLFSIIFDCFFREIRPRGAFRLPRSGPVIFVAAPHANQFVDPMVLMNQVKRESKRRISFLIAAVSYKKKFVGFLSKCQLSIPVVRAQDLLSNGTGKITIDFDSNPLLVKGLNTKFTTECSVRGLIALPKSLGASEIVEILSDTELIIRKEFKSSPQIIKLLGQGTSFRKADKVDQKQVYQRVFDHLSDGNCIGIFPEGGSHDRTDLLPLKAGVAIMALGAMNNNPNCNVKIVPCGMNYFNAHKFRSRAVIEFGHPIEIPKDLVKKYANPETNRESVKDLLDLITTGLKAVTVTCEDFETLMVIQAARRLYAGNFAQYLPLPLVVEMNRRLVLGYQTFKNEPEIQSVKEKVLKYNESLKQLNLPDHYVEDCDESQKLKLLPIFLFRICKLVFLFSLSLPGATLFSPVFLSAKLFSQKKAKEALAKSMVKIKANDVVATWKILVGMGIAPIVYSFYATIGTWYCYKYEIFKYSSSYLGSWLTLYMFGVLVTYAALLTGEQGMDLFKSIRPLYLSLISGSSIKELKIQRHELSEEITYLVNHYGPELFPNDFNLLKMKDHLKINDDINYHDSDEEEEIKTQELRNRRIAKRKQAKLKEKSQSQSNLTPSDSELSLGKKSDSVSDGISLMNSDNSLTNIPMFSDYSLHMNARNPNIKVDSQLPSQAQSSSSIADDFNFKMINGEIHQQFQPPHLPRNNSQNQIEINFTNNKNKTEGVNGIDNGLSNLNSSSNINSTSKKIKLSDKIKSKVRESRDKFK